jgi:anti-anti-sigma regulatory factor
MFSVEYFNQVVIITAYNIRRINFIYIEKLRKLVLQSMKQSCNKVVINMVGVRLINPGAIETLKLLCSIASNIGIKLVLINVDDELRNQITKFDDERLIGISTPEEIEELSGIIN